MKFVEFVMNYPGRLAMPIGVYAGLEMTKASVRQAVSDANLQSQAVLALHEYFKTPVMLTAMDLSAEAETFGCEIRMSDEEIPTVIGRRASSRAEIDTLPEPKPGDKRTQVHLDTAQKLVAHSAGVPVLGGIIGPFSLAGRIFGVSEAMELTINDPDSMKALLDKVTSFLIEYVLAFRSVGATGVIMAEPAAGLLSPRSVGQFSSPYVKRLAEAVQTPEFTVIYHNCGAKLVHLPKILESGVSVLHFGAPMDILAALQQVGKDIILGGNLDPTAVFYSGNAEQVQAETSRLLQATTTYPNFILSSGCDIPPGTPLRNMEAFYAAVAAHNCA